MQGILEKVLLFNCGDCDRAWSFDQLYTHKNEDRCQIDPQAENNIENLKKEIPKPTKSSQVVATPIPQSKKPVFDNVKQTA